jgi:hypothetical protein
MYSYCLCMATLTEVCPCFFLSCKANARLKPAKTGHGPHSSKFLCCSIYFLCSVCFCVVLCIVCFVSFSVLFVCICVLYDCHRVATQLQLNISYHIETGRTTKLSPLIWCFERNPAIIWFAVELVGVEYK